MSRARSTCSVSANSIKTIDASDKFGSKPVVAALFCDIYNDLKLFESLRAAYRRMVVHSAGMKAVYYNSSSVILV
jgi:hypothetical protein